jgi:flagellar biosynthesis regulator FlbT
MPLKLSLKPGEKFVLNGAVLTNGDRRVSLVIERTKPTRRPSASISPS